MAADVLQLFDQVNGAVGMDLAVDRVLLAVQFVVLAGIIAAELARPRDRCLHALIVAVAMLLLVQGQAWWTFDKLGEASYVQQLYHLITRDGARLANLYLAIATCVLGAAYLLARRGVPARPARQPDPADPAAPAAAPYLLVTLWTALASALLLVIAGGPVEALRHPGVSLAGQTVALLAVSLGKLPLLEAVTSRRRPNPYDVALFLWVLLLLLLNSRFLALFAVCQLVLLWDWRRQLPRALLLASAAFGAFIIFGYGLYRDLGNTIPTGTPLDDLSIASFAREHAPNGIADWFYTRNVEGFTGPAGIVSFALLNGGLSHDYGAWELDVVTHLVPNTWRTDPDLPFLGVDQFLTSVYPYDGSVVRPGFELAYGHLGLLGMLLLGLVLGVLPLLLHNRMRASRDPMPVGLLSVQVAQLIRGSVGGAMFYGLADLVGLWVYRRLAVVEANTRDR
jgi:hypothetical protein